LTWKEYQHPTWLSIPDYTNLSQDRGKLGTEVLWVDRLGAELFQALLMHIGRPWAGDDGDLDTKNVITTLRELRGIAGAKPSVARELDSCQALQQGRLAGALVAHDDKLVAGLACSPSACNTRSATYLRQCNMFSNVFLSELVDLS
jgi:hypothetical protein